MTGKSGEVVKALYRRKVDICCVQESRWKGSGARVFGSGDSKYKFFWQGCKEGSAGVGVLVMAKWMDKVIEVKRLSERVMCVKVLIGERLVNCVCAYAPQMGRGQAEKDAFWDLLLSLASNIPTSEMIIVGGDLNGHVGVNIEGYEGVHGGFGFGMRNEEGERVLEFCDAMSMVVANTLFKKEESKLVTYVSGGVKSVIDYLLVRKCDRNAIRNVKVIAGEECVAQHRLLVSDILIKGANKSKKKYLPRLKVWRLKENSVKEEFAQAVIDKKNEVTESQDVNDKWNKMKEVWLQAAEQVCGWSKGPTRHSESWWWNDEVEKAVEEKKRCYKIWHKSKADGDKVKYKEARRNAKKTVAAAQEVMRQEIVGELENSEGKRNVYRIAKQMAKSRQDIVDVNCVKNDEGKIEVDGDRVKEVWRKYMEKLLNEENVWDNDVTCEKVEGPSELIGRDEVLKALRQMKKGKAAGPTGVVSEMLMADEGLSVEWMTALCNLIVAEGKIPDDWRRSVLIPVFKGKGDPMDCGSYRAIKLLEHAMKVIERVFERRIRSKVKVDDMQFGFTPGKGTTDGIFVVRQVQEKHRNKGKELFYAFVDLEKAFDRVPREVTRWALRKSGVDEWLVTTVMAMYEGVETVVRTTSGVSSTFTVKVGLHQGSVLSPLLFVIVMNVVSSELKEGLPWELLYADDLVLMADNEERLRTKIMKWKSGMEAKGLKMNMGKTKVMSGCVRLGGVKEPTGKWPCSICKKGVGRNSLQCIKCEKWVHKRCSGVKGSLVKASQTYVCRRCTRVGQDVAVGNKNFDIGNGVLLESVDKFCYLGDMLDADGGCDSAVTARVRCAWKKFRDFSPILTGKGFSLRLKGKVYASCVRSCLIYGSETWPMKVEHELKLDRTEMSMVRWMCGISLKERKKSEQLREMLGLEAVSLVIRKGRLRWFGHVDRKDDDDWVKRCTVMEVSGTRKKGRPRKTWWDGVQNDMKSFGLTREDAQDRNKWRRVVGGATG
jgi:hypothetical protein